MRFLMFLGWSLLASPVTLGQAASNVAAPASQVNRVNASDMIRRQGIIFIYEGSAKPCDSGDQAFPIGTGFLLILPTEVRKPNSLEVNGIRFLITAEHVVHGRPNIIIRYNTSDGTAFGCHSLDLTGSSKPLQVRANVDLAAVYVPGDITNFRPFGFTEKDIANREEMNKLHVKEGWAVYTVGYFLGAPGQLVNIPIYTHYKIWNHR